MEFELPKERNSIIKVIGVGGGGSNAVNHMFKQGIRGVDFIICNTDSQALDSSPVPTKIQLGLHLTEGLGAGSIPERGKEAAIETIDEIRNILMNNTKMVFITAGMGGGTGTGAAPIIASVAKELGILTVGIVTVPFGYEGKKRRQQAEEGIEQLKKNVDTLLIISNDKLREIYGNLKLSEAFVYADNVLTTAAKSIAEIITVTTHINVDFADVQTVMKDSGVAIMGSSIATGENRAIEAVERALNSPLLSENNIRSARYVLLNVVSGKDEISMDELGQIMDYVQDAAGQTAEIIKGYGIDESLGDKVSITIIATGFKTGAEGQSGYTLPMKKVLKLDDVSSAPQSSSSPEPVAEEMKLVIKEPEVTVVNQQESFQEITPIVNQEAFREVVQQEASEPSFITSKPAEELVHEFEIKDEEISTENAVKEVVPKVREDIQEPVMRKLSPDESLAALAKAEEKTAQERLNQERIMRLKGLTMRLNSPSALADMENVPAFKRRNVSLSNPAHSSESEISRFTLGTDEDKNPSIKPNNSFLHDNVD